MTATLVVCPECGSPVAPGRLSCQSCGTLLASVVGSTHRYSPPVVDPMLPEVDEDRPLASARRADGEADLVATTIPPANLVEAQPPVPPTQPAKRTPRRLPRPRSATPAAAAPAATPSTAVDLEAQASIFGPVPTVAPPILQSWAGSAGSAGSTSGDPSTAVATVTAASTASVKTTASRQPRPPRNQPTVASTAHTNGSTAIGTSNVAVAAPAGSVAGSYLAPSATYAAPVVDRPAEARSTRPRAAGAPTAPPGTAPAVAPTWPSPTSPVAPAGDQNGSFASRGSTATAAPTAAVAGATTTRRMSDWLVIGGATLAIFSFVLPWATDGVFGSKGIGYTAEWGLANLGHLFLVVTALAILLLHVFANSVPVWIRSGVLPTAVGGLLGGLAFAYYARPFGGGTGVAVLLAGAVLLLVGGAVASRPERNEAAAPSV